MKKSKFTLNGKPFSLKHVPPCVTRIISFLDKLPPDDLLTTQELAKRVGLRYDTIRCEISSRKEAKPYCVAVRYPVFQKVWGNKKTIADLRKHKEVVLA